MTREQKAAERESLEAWVICCALYGTPVQEGHEILAQIGYLRRNPGTDAWSHHSPLEGLAALGRKLADGRL